MLTNEEISEKLSLLGQLLEIHGENPFKIKAYHQAADVLETLDEGVGELIARGRLGTVGGIGPAIKAKVEELYATGTTPQLTDLMQVTPEGIVEMLKVKGMGPKKILTVWRDLGITTVEDLYIACQENRLSKASGFGQKTQESILQAILFMRENASKFHYAQVRPAAERLVQELRSLSGGSGRIELTGEIRRKMPVIRHLDLLLDGVAMDALLALDRLPDHLAWVQEDPAAPVWRLMPLGVEVHLHRAQGDFFVEWVRTTGHADFAAAVQVPAGTYEHEAAVLTAAGLAYVEPEMREGRGEVELARAGNLPRLVTMQDIRGAVHNHSTWSDGAHTLEEMARACMERGWEYFGISDHSKSAFYANGLSEGRIEQQHMEIDALNAKLGPFRIFKGIEADILTTGALDYDADVLRTFDFVVASVHSLLRMDEERATQRLLKAIENPYTTILGHPTGRLLLLREGYPIDHRRVIDACAANGVILELNASPYRLDLDWTWIAYALEKGVMISVNPDAHKTAGLDDTFWGLEAARKGGLTAAMCLNAQPLPRITEIFAAKKAGRKA